MATTWIAGYITEVKIGADQIESMVASGGLTLNKNIMLKHVAGAQEPVALAGLVTGTLSISGSVSAEDIAKLNTAFESSAVVAYILQVGEDGGTIDAGAFAGNCMIESLSIAFDADDSFTFSLDAVLDGLAAYAA